MRGVLAERQDAGGGQQLEHDRPLLGGPRLPATQEAGGTRVCDIHTIPNFDEFSSNLSPKIISDRQISHSIAENFN